MSDDISYKVLVIDDAFFIRKLIKKAIESKPINTGGTFQIAEEAINGESGIQKYFEVKPDLVTLDINMPGMNGIEVVNKILEKDPSAKILVISGNDKVEIKNEILKAGALDYIQKPFQNAYLWERLDKIFNLNSTVEEQDNDSDDFEINNTDIIDVEESHSNFLKKSENINLYTKKDTNENAIKEASAELENNKTKSSLSFNIVSPLENIEPKEEVSDDEKIVNHQENKNQSIVVNAEEDDDDDILSTNNSSTNEIDNELDISIKDEEKLSDIDFEISSPVYSIKESEEVKISNQHFSEKATEDSKSNKEENNTLIEFDIVSDTNIEPQAFNEDKTQFDIPDIEVSEKHENIELEITSDVDCEDNLECEATHEETINTSTNADINEKIIVGDLNSQEQKEEMIFEKEGSSPSINDDGDTKYNIDKDQYGFKHIMSFDIDKELVTSNNDKVDNQPIEEISIDIDVLDKTDENDKTEEKSNDLHDTFTNDFDIVQEDDSNIAKTSNKELNNDVQHYNIETSKDNALNENEFSDEKKVEKKTIYIEPPRDKVLKEIYSSHTRHGVVQDMSGDLFEEEEKECESKNDKAQINIISKIKSLFNKK